MGSDGAGRGVVAISLPLMPAGSLLEGRSYLGVVTGCARPWPFSDVEAGMDGGEGGSDVSEAGADVGEAGRDVSDAGADTGGIDIATVDVFRPPARAAICGSSSDAPNAGLVLVRMSQREVGARFGFQAVHASTAVATARIAIERAGGASPIFSADLGPYQIVPRDGLIAVAKDDFGITVGAATLRVASPVSVFPTVAVSLAASLAASEIDEAALSLGERFSLVLIGAQPGQNPGAPWNAARIAVVRNAPLAGGD
jgi:hypothetical protein